MNAANRAPLIATPLLVTSLIRMILPVAGSVSWTPAGEAFSLGDRQPHYQLGVMCVAGGGQVAAELVLGQ